MGDIRESNGQFKKGVSGNPVGMAKGTRHYLVNLQRQLEVAVRENIRADEVGEIVAKMVSMAKEGNIKAAKLILDKVISNATPAEDEAGDKQNVVIFRIENATFGAKDAAKETTGEAIDADFTASENPHISYMKDHDGNQETS